MTITRRGFLKSLLAIGAAAVIPEVLRETIATMAEPVKQVIAKMTPDTWHNIAFIRTSNDVKLYLDGKRVDAIEGIVLETTETNAEYTSVSLKDVEPVSDSKMRLTFDCGAEYPLEFDSKVLADKDWTMEMWVKPMPSRACIDSLRVTTDSTQRHPPLPNPTVKTYISDMRLITT